MKKYIRPNIHIKEIELDANIMAASVQTAGLPEDYAPTFGGDNDGTHNVGAKGFTCANLWEDAEE